MSGTLDVLADQVTVIAGIGVVLGVIGTIVPVLPGSIIVTVSVLLWALVAGGWAWAVLGGVVLLLVSGQVLEYVTAGRRLKGAGVPNRSLLAGALLGLVGFFVIPVLGLVLGFLAGLYLAERVRQPDAATAWRSTVVGMRAAGLMFVIELGAVLLAATLWFSVVLSGTVTV